MQTIYGDASNINITAQKRLLRVLYGQTQATPYACYLDQTSFRDSSGNFRIPQSTDTTPIARSANVFTLQGSIVPGTVLIKSTNENVVVATGAAAAQQPFGLLGSWLGGTFGQLTQINEVQAWRGPDSLIQLLAPAWNDTGVAAAIAAAGPGTNVYLYAQTDGRLGITNPGGGAISVGWIVSRPSSAQLTINLTI
jgi:hypothetical protein